MLRRVASPPPGLTALSTSATAWMLYEMQARGVMPAALVLNAVNPIMVQGVALADFTMISGFDCDITQAIPNGATVEIDPSGDRPFIRVL